MSSNYTLHCDTCDEDLRELFRNADRDLKALVKAAPLLEQLALVERGVWAACSEPLIEVETVVRVRGTRLPLDWFIDHQGHVLRVVESY